MTMTRMTAPALLGAILTVGCVATAAAQTAAKTADPALVEKYIASAFGKAPAEWQARIKPDETLQACNRFRNDVTSAEADRISSTGGGRSGVASNRSGGTSAGASARGTLSGFASNRSDAASASGAELSGSA